ncbi:unnamed protein product, partial [Adineta steineri]
MASRTVCLWLLFMIITQTVGEDTQSMIMSLTPDSKFQCTNTTCLPFISVIASNIRNCQIVCLTQSHCRAATFHRSTSNCELFGDMLNQNENMLTDVDATTMNIISGTRFQPEWTTTGNMSTVRYIHTASVLANGSVLVTGGQNSVGDLDNAELYNPSTGTWTTTGNMNVLRAAHTASILANGSVLVVGGHNGTSYLDSAELYNPSTGTWTTTGNMSIARYVHTASTLANGEVLVVGGSGNGGCLNSAELYNPLTVTVT